jgi:glutathione S-transferase
MRLFYSGNSPFVRKVMVVAHELDLAAGIEIDPTGAHPIDRKASLVIQNPLGKVPTLVLDDGTQLFDSPVIAEYLASTSPKGNTLFPPSGPERWRVLMEQALADGMLDAALLARYEPCFGPRNSSSSHGLRGRWQSSRRPLSEWRRCRSIRRQPSARSPSLVRWAISTCAFRP